ncbi:chitinase [Streptomyces sp. HNM0574]|nr:chitinase [Streptomyces sp. HNM0574]
MTNTGTHRRRVHRKVKLAGAAAAAATVAAGGLALAGNASAGQEDAPRAAGPAFAPYVDTSLQPSYDLVKSAGKTGVKEFHLAFVTAGDGSCVPKWGGTQDLGENAVARQVDALRAKGGDVRISFGGANGSELALACDSVAELTAAYGKVVETFGLKKADFDIEGGALPDTEANTRRAKAVAALQKEHKDLDVSFTLPVMPEGLTPDGERLLKDAKRNGVRVDAVNVMAMDYGPSYDGDMGAYATSAAKATQKQVKSALDITDDAEAWATVAITPMIGVNDVPVEIFTPEDAAEVRKFAEAKGMAWVSMWSGTRDKQCPGGAKDQADPTCSSVEQQPYEFTEAFTG